MSTEQKPDPEVVARELTDAMVRRGVGTRVLSRRVRELIGNVRGTSYATLEAYRSGTVRAPRREVIEAAAVALRVPPERLLWGKGPLTEEDAQAQRVARSGLDQDEELRAQLQQLSREFDPAGGVFLSSVDAWLLLRLAIEYAHHVDPHANDIEPQLDLVRRLVLAPFEALGLMPGGHLFNTYFRAMVLALELAPAAGQKLTPSKEA